MLNDVLPTGTGFSQKVYERLKWLVLIFIPALSTLYFTLSGQLDLPNPEVVMGVLASVATFLGTLLGISNANYKANKTYDGDVVVEKAPEGGTIFALEYDGDVDEIPGKSELVFKVVDKNGPFWQPQG